jgi:hypothetical protein
MRKTSHQPCDTKALTNIDVPGRLFGTLPCFTLLCLLRGLLAFDIIPVAVLVAGLALAFTAIRPGRIAFDLLQMSFSLCLDVPSTTILDFISHDHSQGGGREGTPISRDGLGWAEEDVKVQ